MADNETEFSMFAGIKDDADQKQCPPKYFHICTNFNFPDSGLPGVDKILFPLSINRIGTSQIDGQFEYRYLDGSSIPQTENIAVTQGIVFKTSLTPHTAQAVTFTATPTNTVNLNAHTYSNGDGVYFSVGTTGALPAALTAGKIYFVVNKAANTFQVALTQGGAAISLATAGTTPTQYATSTPTILKTGLSTGRVSFASYNDKLYIANGQNYVNAYYGSLGVVAEMGAPAAVVSAAAGNPNGAYYYAMTYVTAGREDIIGSVSNTVNAVNLKVTLTLPIGYSGTLTRKIYRTVAGGTTLKLLATIANNTDLTYTDNTADGGLGADIGSTNNELPKPYFLCVTGFSLFGTKVTKYPTQLFKTNTNLEVWDLASFIDVANTGNDNTPIEGIGVDFGKIVVGTAKQIYFVEPSDTVVNSESVKPTRANVGIKDGHSVVSVPAFGDFAGGLMFLSTLNDIRLMNGQQELPVTTTYGNVSTENWSQDIRTSLNADLLSYSNICAEFFNYKYHLCIDNIKHVFDIRAKGWTRHSIKSANYTSTPRCMVVMGSPLKLYTGQSDGWIEKEYDGIKYRGEDVTATIESEYLEVSRLFKWFKKLVFWFKTSMTSTTTISTVLDSNDYYPITATITLLGGVFNPTYFNPTYFLSSGKGDSDYRVVNITQPCRWGKFTLTCTSGNISFLQWNMVGDPLKNKEDMT